MRILVVIASYGSQNDAWLQRVLAEYRSMSYQIRIVVISNIHKELGPDVEVRVELPSKNPHSLPFGHLPILAEQVTNHDLFIYSEDDILITAGNIEAFLEQAAALPSDQVPGFLRIEKGLKGQIQYCDMHGSGYWDTQSTETHGKHTFAFFSNEHAACYLLTRSQLQRALDSGKYLTAPYAGRYNMLETAATNVYTQCGLRKMICISDLDSSSVHHLPNKYFAKFGLPREDLRRQLDELCRLEQNGGSYAPLIQMQARLKGARYLRDHYEPVRTEILPLIPKDARSMVSFGCGQTEIALAQRGVRVTAVPVDPVVSVTAVEKGVELVRGDLESALTQLQGRTFDCLLLINVLHLVGNPDRVVSSFLQFVRKDGIVLVLSPRVGGARLLWGWLTRGEGLRAWRDAGVNITTPELVRKWLKSAGASPEELVYPAARKLHGLRVFPLKYLPPFIVGDFVLRARKTAGADL